MNKKSSPLGIPMTTEEYAEQWEINSRSFYSEGHYDWMSGQLGEAKIVLEVGAGSGNGTCALVKGGRKVISIEPNEKLAKTAFANLNDQGISVEFLEPAEIPNRILGGAAEVTIVVVDILSEELDSILTGLNFDAIVCWLIGAEPDRIATHLGTEKEEFVGPEMAEYRKIIHQRCYRLGELSLKAGGHVHLVDRLGIGSWNEKDGARQQLAEFHTEISGMKYHITKEDTFLRRANKNIQTSKIQYFAETPEQVNTLVFTSIKGRLFVE